MKTLVLCAALAMSGCSLTDRHSVLPPVTAKIGKSLKQACPSVSNIPDRDLTQADVARLWAADRRSLLTCARRHGGLVKAVAILEGGQ